MSIVRFSAEASLYESTLHYAGRSTKAGVSAEVSPAVYYPGCMGRCVKMCESDPNISDYNDCQQACKCSCSGHSGCWQ
jgi:hypothetical protein